MDANGRWRNLKAFIIPVTFFLPLCLSFASSCFTKMKFLHSEFLFPSYAIVLCHSCTQMPSEPAMEWKIMSHNRKKREKKSHLYGDGFKGGIINHDVLRDDDNNGDIQFLRHYKAFIIVCVTICYFSFLLRLINPSLVFHAKCTIMKLSRQ